MKSCFAMRPAMCRKPSKPKWFCHSFASVPASLFPALFVQTESIVIVTMRLLVAILVALVACAVAQCPAGTCPQTETCCTLADGSYGCCPYPVPSIPTIFFF